MSVYRTIGPLVILIFCQLLFDQYLYRHISVNNKGLKWLDSTVVIGEGSAIIEFMAPAGTIWFRYQRA